jgi:hypothetical protein
MRVQLIRKFADIINGIDLTKVRVGDIVNLKAHEAALLVMEGWARELPSATRQQPAASHEEARAPVRRRRS